MKSLLLVFLGGGLGSVLRYAVSLWFPAVQFGNYPLGTLLANLAGSFLIGLLGSVLISNAHDTTRLLLMVGLLGGFTTFSSYALECVNLYQGGMVKLSFIHLLANNMGGILLALGGLSLGNLLFSN